MKLILLGAPGAGKGTQAEVISERFEIPTISTGNVLRAAIKNGTPTGVKAKAFIDAGALVPDEVVIEIIRERLAEPDCAGGFILDGFPRTLAQAEALDKMGFGVDHVVYINVPSEIIVKRLGGRRVCESCGATYHIENQPSSAGELCEKCGSRLIVRKDDRPETILERLRVYNEQTFPLVDYYKNKGILSEVDGNGSVEATTEKTLRALEEQA